MDICVDCLSAIVTSRIDDKPVIGVYIPVDLSRRPLYFTLGITWPCPQHGNQSQAPMMGSFGCSDQNETDDYSGVEEVR